jgi:hypothetical protein
LYVQSVEKTEGAIKNGYSRDIDNIGDIRLTMKTDKKTRQYRKLKGWEHNIRENHRENQECALSP